MRKTNPNFYELQFQTLKINFRIFLTIEIRTSKQEREERHRSNYWHKSESHDADSRSYSRHNRRDRQKDFISSSR